MAHSRFVRSHSFACIGVLGLGLAVAPSPAHAQDPCDALPPECASIDDGLSLNRALEVDCETICIVAELPIRSVPIPVDGTSLHTVHAGSHPLPAFRVEDGASLTIHGGVVHRNRAIAHANQRPAQILMDVQANATLVLDGTRIHDPAPEDRTTRDNHAFAVIRQAAVGGASVTLKGVQTTEAFYELLVSQQTLSADGGPCTHDATLNILGKDDGTPSILQFGPGGVLSAPVCWRGIDRSGHREGLDGPFAEGSGGPTTIERLELTGKFTPHQGVLDEVPYRWQTLTSPGPISIRNSLFADLAVKDDAVVSSDASITIEDSLFTGLTLQEASLVEAPTVSVERGIACDVSSEDPEARGLFGLSTDSTGVGSMAQMSLDGVSVPLFDAADGSRVALRHLTARAPAGEALLTTGHAFVELRNSYLEGAWALPLVPSHDAPDVPGDVVEGLRLAGSETGCPTAVEAGCAVLEESALVDGTAECGVVLREGFHGWASLDRWPARMPALTRLIPTQDQQSSLLAPGADPATIDLCDTPEERPTDWDCEEPFLVGAWAGWNCGLEQLDPCPLTERPEPVADTAERPEDSGRPDTDHAEATAAPDVHADFGCAARASVFAMLLGPLAWGVRRRQTPSHDGGAQ